MMMIIIIITTTTIIIITITTTTTTRECRKLQTNSSIVGKLRQKLSYKEKQIFETKIGNTHSAH
jgi:hypothetical protein